MSVAIIYWSGTGNTEAMAGFIAKGAGSESSMKVVSEATIDDVKNATAVAFGCPSMGDEVLEESEFQPFIDSVIDSVKGKKIGLFGSYGWGDGRWMREWVETMKAAGADVINEGLIVNGAPTGEDEEKCVELGKALANI